MRKTWVKILVGTIVFFLILGILLLFFIQPLTSLQDVHQNPEIVIEDAQGQEIMHYINEHRITPIDLSLMSQKNIDLLLYMEDRDFYRHSGFNFQRILKTLWTNWTHHQSHGASTITQQYIKNVYLSSDKSWTRKIKEIYYAIKLEQLASKDEILEGYLNCIYLGNNIYGIENAGLFYFGKHYFELTAAEMISFIALLNAPSYYSEHLDLWNQRKNEIAHMLLKGEQITADEYQNAIKPLEFSENTKIYPDDLLYYTDAVYQEFKTIVLKAKFHEIIRIQTRYLPTMTPTETSASVALLAVDKEGFIVSCLGDSDYSASGFNIAFNGKRDIGSTIKPLLYYEALKCGYTPATTQYSAPFSFQYQNEWITIQNSGTYYPMKEISMKTALATSDNIYAIKTHLDIGMKTLANHLKKYQIDAPSLPSLALGSIGMSLYQLTRIYTQFFTEGEYLSLHFIEQIRIKDKVLFHQNKQSVILGIPRYFKQIKNLMSSVFDLSIPHATGNVISPFLTTECYGKSGLTDYDSYMIGFNEQYLVSVWVGYLDNRELKNNGIKRLPKTIFLKKINQLSSENSA